MTVNTLPKCILKPRHGVPRRLDYHHPRPGAGDGLCAACPITGGESTENEMFLINGTYYLLEDETE